MLYAIGVTYEAKQDEYRVLSGFEPGACCAGESDEVFLSRAEAETEMKLRMAGDPSACIDTFDYTARA